MFLNCAEWVGGGRKDKFRMCLKDWEGKMKKKRGEKQSTLVSTHYALHMSLAVLSMCEGPKSKGSEIGRLLQVN